MQALRYETPEFLEHEEEEEEDEEEEGQSEDKKDLSLEATYSECEAIHTCTVPLDQYIVWIFLEEIFYCTCLSVCACKEQNIKETKLNINGAFEIALLNASKDCINPHGSGFNLCTVATKQRLEQELAEAAQEDHRDESGGSGGDTSSRGEGEEGGSGSDSEREAGPLPVQMQNSLEMSVWSLDVSLPPGGMESSVYETEVRNTHMYGRL